MNKKNSKKVTYNESTKEKPRKVLTLNCGDLKNWISVEKLIVFH